jgi:hypothetical protein
VTSARKAIQALRERRVRFLNLSSALEEPAQQGGPDVATKNAASDKIPANTLILHWSEDQNAWAELPWLDWVRFRGYGKERSSLLIGAEAGEHYFLVCMLGSHGELSNVIPHRYVISNDARLVYGFDGLEEGERQEADRLEELVWPTIEDIERFNELGQRGFSANLPPLRTVHSLLQAMPGIAGAPPGAACWNFLSAIGICRSSMAPN